MFTNFMILIDIHEITWRQTFQDTNIHCRCEKVNTIVVLHVDFSLTAAVPTAVSIIVKVLGHYLHHDLGIITCTMIWVCHHYYGFFFAHLLILEYPDHHQNVISSSLYYPGPLHKISSQSVHNFLSNVVHRQTNKQTNQRYRKHNLLCQG